MKNKLLLFVFISLAGLIFFSSPSQAAPLANNNVDIDNVFFDQTGGVFTDQTAAAASPAANDVTLASSTLATAHYVGMQYIFNALTYNIGTAGNATGTIAWEYWNGAWTAIPGVTDNTNQFRTAGINTVTFAPPADWATTTVNAVTNRYWIRARTTGVYAVTQPLGTQISAVEFNLQLSILKMDGQTAITSLNQGNFTVAGGDSQTVFSFREFNAPSGVYQFALTRELHIYTATSTGYLNVLIFGGGVLTTALTIFPPVPMIGDLLFQPSTCGVTFATVCIQPVMPASVAIAGTTEFKIDPNAGLRYAAPTGNYAYTVSSPGYTSVSGSVNVVSGNLSAVSVVLNLASTGGGGSPPISAPIISNVAATSTAGTAKISWTTDKSANSQVVYGLSANSYPYQSALDNSFIASHAVNLTNLVPSTTYYYKVISTDSSNNKTVSSEYSFQTLAITPSPITTPASSPTATPIVSLTPTPTLSPVPSPTPSPTSTPPPTFSPTPTPVTPLPSTIITRNLLLGVKDREVEVLQRFLARDKSLYPEGLITGYFGSLTQAAVKRFQAKYGIKQIGIVGPLTRAKLNEVFGKE